MFVAGANDWTVLDEKNDVSSGVKAGVARARPAPKNRSAAAASARAAFTSASFAGRGRDLMPASRERARPCVKPSSRCTRRRGRRGRVYAAPRPALCAAKRAATSLAMPVYKLPSAQRAM